MDGESDVGGDDEWESEVKEVEKVYRPLGWISEMEGIEGAHYKQSYFEDQRFVEQMIQHPLYREIVRELSENAKNHVVQARLAEQMDETKRIIVTTFTRELRRRVDGCCALSREIVLGRAYPLGVVRQAEEEICRTLKILEPFVLQEDEMEEEQELLLDSYFHTLTGLHRKMLENSHVLIQHRMKMEAMASG